MKIIGIDYSYTSPAICILGENFLDSEFHFLTKKKSIAKSFENCHGTLLMPFQNDTIKFDYISDWCLEIIDYVLKNDKDVYVCVEGYSMGSRQGLVFNIAENGGVLKNKLLHKSFIPLIAPPKTVKKYFTGNGNANKDLMIDTLEKQENIKMLDIFPFNKIAKPLDDIVDSYAIARYCMGTL